MTGTEATFDVRELAASHDFVRRLAHSLVFDQDRVDDVVQDAWLAALQRPPRDRGAAPTWFFRVLQNVARRRARDEARRRNRERSAAAAEALPSVQDVVAQEQQRRRVVDAVLALPEPYRATVIARYFEELAPGEIARRRRVPGATVRSQLLRGLEMLRSRLDQEHGGDRAAWGLALLPLLRPPLATGMGSALSIAGALLMTKGLFAGVALALCLLGYLWWNNSAGPVPAGASAIAADAAPRAAAAANSTAAPHEGQDAAQRVAVATPTAVDLDRAFANAGLRGRVVGADGAPAPGQLVRALGIDGVSLFADAPDRGDRKGPLLPRGEARTASDGTFAIDGVFAHTRYAIEAAADGDDRTIRIVEATTAPGEVLDVGDIVLTRKGAIIGRAVDEDGAPLPGAEALAVDLPAVLSMLMPIDRFDPRHGGVLTIPVPAQSGADLERARSRLRSYFGSDLFQKTGLDERDDTMTLVLDRMAWAEQLFAALPIARATAGPDGAFKLRGVEPGSTMLIVRAAGRLPGGRPRVAVAAGAAQDIGEIRLGAGETLAGTVHWSDGRPVAGAEVRVAAIGALGYRGVAFCDAPVRADANGHFHASGLPRGRAMVAVRRDDGAPWHTLGPIDCGDDLDIALPEPTVLIAHFAHGDQALRQAEIELFAGPPLNELRRLGMQRPLPLAGRLQWTADDTFVLRDLPAGCCTLRITAPGRETLETVVVLPREEPLPLELLATAPLRVRVRDGAGHAVAGAKVYLHHQAPTAAERNVLPTDYGLPRWTTLPRLCGATDADGGLDVADRPAAAVVVLAAHPTLPSASLEVAAAVAVAELTLPQPGELHGRLFDHGRAADPAAWSVVAEGDDVGTMPARELRAVLAADGSFAFAHLAPGDWRVRAAKRETEPVTLHRRVERLREAIFSFGIDSAPGQRVRVLAGQTAELSFDVDPNAPPPDVAAARLDGRALENGTPLAGAVLVRHLDWWHTAELATVAADGSFVAAAVVPGDHQLRLLRAGEELWAGSVALAPGSSMTLDLSWQTGALAGTAAFADGRRVEDLTAVAVGSRANGRFRRSVVIAADGRFAFAALPAGEYRIEVSGNGGGAEPVAATVAAGSNATIQLRLLPNHEVRGRVDLGQLSREHSMLLLHCDDSFFGLGIGEDGSFRCATPKPGVYEVSIQVDGVTHRVEPSKIDLTHGDVTGIVLKVLGPATDDDR